jgi:hypothetical protein
MNKYKEIQLSMLYTLLTGVLNKVSDANNTGVMLDEKETKVLELRLKDMKAYIEAVIYE